MVPATWDELLQRLKSLPAPRSFRDAEAWVIAFNDSQRVLAGMEPRTPWGVDRVSTYIPGELPLPNSGQARWADEDTGEPLPCWIYGVELEDGRFKWGLTDADGRTARIETAEPQRLSFYFFEHENEIDPPNPNDDSLPVGTVQAEVRDSAGFLLLKIRRVVGVEADGTEGEVRPVDEISTMALGKTPDMEDLWAMDGSPPTWETLVRSVSAETTLPKMERLQALIEGFNLMHRLHFRQESDQFVNKFAIKGFVQVALQERKEHDDWIVLTAKEVIRAHNDGGIDGGVDQFKTAVFERASMDLLGQVDAEVELLYGTDWAFATEQHESCAGKRPGETFELLRLSRNLGLVHYQQLAPARAVLGAQVLGADSSGVRVVITTEEYLPAHVAKRLPQCEVTGDQIQVLERLYDLDCTKEPCKVKVHKRRVSIGCADFGVCD
jgi:hypothetical protein